MTNLNTSVRKMPIDAIFYKEADVFFPENTPYGLTYDDVSLATLYSDILPHEANIETQLSDRLQLKVPILSADMDTVTESDMAIAMALHGGLGLIHYNMTARRQIKEVARVKNHVHGLIQDPIKITPDQKIADVLQLIDTKKFSFKTFPVVDNQGKLMGLLPGRMVRERYRSRDVKEAMIYRTEVHTIEGKAIAKNPIATADAFFHEHIGIHKLLVVDEQDRLRGLFTLSDIERITEERRAHMKPARDQNFRLLCGAAVHTPRTPGGEIDKRVLLEHAGQLVDEGVDALAISTAHGHTTGVGTSVRLLRDAFSELTLIAGNVTSAGAVEFLADSGADAIKVGQGPGSICTTRMIAGVGIPQLTALYVASRAASRKKIALIADGGITYSGDIVKALTLADAVICGHLLAGCREAPGKIIEINGKLYKEYRGMGSTDSMKEGSAMRYGHLNLHKKAAAEGIVALKEASGSVNSTLTALIGGIQSGMGYLGVRHLRELKSRVRYIRVTLAGQRESKPHDVTEIKTSQLP